MKRSLLTTFCFVSVLGIVTAQKMVVRTYIEKTVSSPKTGTSVGFENRFGWEYGAFFQNASLMNAEAKANLPRTYEKDFSGIYFAAPFVRREKFMAKVQIRTGLVNSANFAITPSFFASYSPVKLIQIGGGVGVRTFSPAVQGFISFKL